MRLSNELDLANFRAHAELTRTPAHLPAMPSKEGVASKTHRGSSFTKRNEERIFTLDGYLVSYCKIKADGSKGTRSPSRGSLSPLLCRSAGSSGEGMKAHCSLCYCTASHAPARFSTMRVDR